MLYDCINIKSSSTDPWLRKTYQWLSLGWELTAEGHRAVSGWWNFIVWRLYCHKVDLKGAKTDQNPAMPWTPLSLLRASKAERRRGAEQGWPASRHDWPQRLSKARGRSLPASYPTWVLEERLDLKLWENHEERKSFCVCEKGQAAWNIVDGLTDFFFSLYSGFS